MSKNTARYDAAMRTRNAEGDCIDWYDIDHPQFRLSGLAYYSRGGVMRRLPDDPKLPEAVRFLSHHTAGVRLDFKTTSKQIRLRVKLSHSSHMDHMAQTGSCGFDLYSGAPGKNFLVGTARFPFDADAYETTLLPNGFQTEKMRDFTLNFPLYSGVEKIEIGFDEKSEIAAPEPWSDSCKMVFYGTSITQGGCASRPGMVYSSLLGRALNRQVLNFGFSGNGKGEKIVAEYLADIEDVGVFVLDYEPNAKPDGIRATLNEFIDTLRQKHPDTPIIVMSSLRFNQELVFTEDTEVQQKDLAESAKFQRREVERRRRAGDGKIFFVNGASLCGKNWHEFSVDGCHQTDLGFYVISERLLPKLKKILAIS
ncbi:MAG: SGNH/GDSL hydrolase family protein [Lentisphaeria bacterium]|nr:SGNH/GDSL hydrolase family protein [Lentisphaeria bacterium]